MKRHDFEWTSKNFVHTEQGLEAAAYLTTKALGVVYKHCLIPMAEYDLMEWCRYDHYRQNISELEEEGGDEVWIKPWLIGQWMDGKECILQLEPKEFLEELYEEKDWAELDDWKHRHKRGAIFGIYFTVTRRVDNWSAVFALRLDDRPGAKKLHDLPVREVICLSTDGENKKIEEWLNWAYKESA